MVSHYPISLSNLVPISKKSGEVRVCVDYRDLNKASLKDDFPLPNIHIFVDNTAGHEIESFGDCFLCISFNYESSLVPNNFALVIQFCFKTPILYQ